MQLYMTDMQHNCFRNPKSENKTPILQLKLSSSNNKEIALEILYMPFCSDHAIKAIEGQKKIGLERALETIHARYEHLPVVSCLARK